MRLLNNQLRMVFSLFFLGGLFLSTSLLAQISQGGEPYSYTHLLENPVFVQPNPSELQYKSDEPTKDCNAFEFAKFLTLNESLKSNSWQVIEALDGSSIYRLAIQSPGALAIGAYFSHFSIPKGAKLFIYSTDHQQLIGAFTEKNNPKSGFFATEYLSGEELIIEYQEPAAVAGKGYFVVSEILHAYRGFGFNDERGFGGSDACEDRKSVV